MPYIKEEDRKVWDGHIRVLFQMMEKKGITPGELNYLITSLVCAYVIKKGKNYTHINDALGALDAVSKEFYRRVVAKYEDKKIEENGDLDGLGI